MQRWWMLEGMSSYNKISCNMLSSDSAFIRLPFKRGDDRNREQDFNREFSKQLLQFICTFLHIVHTHIHTTMNKPAGYHPPSSSAASPFLASLDPPPIPSSSSSSSTGKRKSQPTMLAFFFDHQSVMTQTSSHQHSTRSSPRLVATKSPPLTLTVPPHNLHSLLLLTTQHRVLLIPLHMLPS